MNQNDTCIVFCNNVKRLREEHGLSRKEMAHIMGIGVKRLQEIEAENFPENLGVDVAWRLASHFHISISSLFL